MSKQSGLRIALVAPSGSGKSTTAGLLREAFEAADRQVAILKLAAPLYSLQRAFYDAACHDMRDGTQDQHLLEHIATELRRIDRQSLVKNFAQRIERCEADVIINDDLRDDVTDWPYLRQQGFSIIKIVTAPAVRASRLQGRDDVSIVENSPLDIQMSRILADYVLPNNGSLDVLRTHVEALAGCLLGTLAQAAA
ncbi:dephospho-CoA kinase [Burkholderia gladioli]|uniref:dephospho-CoA kinase n=1 Tax=Burkholderia gladioli TaxID=28095 RepID=UPI00163F32B5|nr:dephospho-CoA kinase [Burkholderia gladioli]